MGVSLEFFKSEIEKAFLGADVFVHNPQGDEEHYDVVIDSNEFNNITRIARHRLFNERLAHIINDIHAISLKTNPKS